MSDLINRDEAIKAIDDNFSNIPIEQTTEILKVRRTIRELPSADRPQGEWIEQEDDYYHYWECSECGMGVGLDDIRNFCPNCGARMFKEHVELRHVPRVTHEMMRFREMLDAEHIEWTDASDPEDSEIYICRTHFKHCGYEWSVIHGFGTFGGVAVLTGKDRGLLELTSNAVDNGNPVGWLTAEEAMQYVKKGDSADEDC